MLREAEVDKTTPLRIAVEPGLELQAPTHVALFLSQLPLSLVHVRSPVNDSASTATNVVLGYK